MLVWALSRRFSKLKISNFFRLFSVFESEEEIEETQEVLKRCDFLSNLGLEFNQECKIDSSGVELLRQSLETLSLLKHLGFFFSSEIERGMQEMQESFIKDLANLSCLESVDLQFDPKKPVGEKLILVSETLKKLQSLQDLNLMCGDPSDEELSALGRIFEELPLLKSVDLSLLNIKPWLTKEGFYALNDGLIKAKSLEKISLYLSNFSEVDDQDIKQLMENLEEQTSLKKLSLYFDKLPKLTEEGFEAINQSLKRMDSLQLVKLGFFECSKVDEQSVQTLVQNLKELPFKICCSLNPNDFFLSPLICRVHDTQ